MLLKMNLHGDMQIRHLTPGDYQQVRPIVAGMTICAPYLFKKWSETSNHYKAAAFGFFLVAEAPGLKGSSTNLRMIPICWKSQLDFDKSYMNERFYNPNEKGHRNFCRILTPDEALCARSSWSGSWVWNLSTLSFEQTCAPLFAPFLNWLTEDSECVVQGAWCTKESWIDTPKLSTTKEMIDYAAGRKKAHLAASLAQPKKRARGEQ